MSLRDEEANRRYHRNHYVKNRNSVRAKAKKYYEENKELCDARVKKRGEKLGKVVILAYSREHNKIHAAKLRAEALTAYGNRCQCCGEDTPEFLTIDHVHGDGRHHRKQIGRGGTTLYRWLKKHGYPKDRFTLLCFNCNCAKGTNKQCPHQRVDTNSVLLGIAC
jgi:hypothetical protein